MVFWVLVLVSGGGGGIALYHGHKNLLLKHKTQGRYSTAKHLGLFWAYFGLEQAQHERVALHRRKTGTATAAYITGSEVSGA